MELPIWKTVAFMEFQSIIYIHPIFIFRTYWMAGAMLRIFDLMYEYTKIFKIHILLAFIIYLLYKILMRILFHANSDGFYLLKKKKIPYKRLEMMRGYCLGRALFSFSLVLFTNLLADAHGLWVFGCCFGVFIPSRDERHQKNTTEI